MSGRFWPIAEAAQADYEALRAAALAGEPARDELAAARFARRGLGGLIAWPSSEPIYLGVVIGARRPAWSGSEDPRAAALGEGLRLPRRPRARKRRAGTGGRAMRVALYARVSTERQQERGTVASQLELLRAAARADDHQVVAEFVDDGYSGARLDRPALDRLRDAAEAGALDAVLCLCADRLARAYAYQVLILDELERFGVPVHFLDGPAPGDDPQAKLLIQVQGVIAEYERAKIAERYRRGKLHRARAGEVFFWKVPYGYRRVAAAPGRPARMEIFEPEAEIVRAIFAAHADQGASIRQICHDLHDRGIPSPTGKPIWGTSTLQRLLANEAYIGRVYYNRRETINGAPASRGARRTKTRYRERPREQWITIPVPAIIDAHTFERSRHVRRENPKWSPRGIEPGYWLLRGLIECGHCGVGCNCHKMRGRNGTHHRYYYCRNHDILRAGSEHLRCPERNIRADELDAYVFDQVRRALSEPAQLLAGERAVITTTPPTDDELIGGQLTTLERKRDQTERERGRLLDAYQAALLDLDELTRRTAALTARRDQLAAEHTALTDRRDNLARENRLRRGLAGFAERVLASLDELDFDGRQRLLRLVVEKVRVTGWRIEIHLKIPIADDPDTTREPRPPTPEPEPSSDMSLRSHGEPQGRFLPAQGQRPRLPAARQAPRNRVTNHPRPPRRGPQNARECVIRGAGAPKSAQTGHHDRIPGTNGTAPGPAGHAREVPNEPRKRLRAPTPDRLVHFSTGADGPPFDRP